MKFRGGAKGKMTSSLIAVPVLDPGFSQVEHRLNFSNPNSIPGNGALYLLL